MNKQEKEIIISLGVDATELNAKLKEAEGTTATFASKMNSVAGGMDKVGKSMTLMSLPIIALGKQSLSTFNDFEQGLYSLSAVMGESRSSENIAKLEAEMKKLGSTTMFSASQVSGGIQAMAQAGLDTESILGMIGDATKFATASEMELNEASEIVMATMGQFGLEVKDSTKIMDEMVYTGNKGMASVDDLGRSMKNAGAQAKAANTSYEETLSFLNILASKGIKGEIAGSQLGSTLKFYSRIKAEHNSLIESGEKLTGVYAQLAENGVGKIEGSLGDFVQQLKVVQKTMGEAEFTGMLQQIFQDNAAFIEGIVTDTSGTFENFTKDITDNAAGTMDEIAAIFEQSPEGKIAKLNATVETFQRTLGAAISPVFVEIMEALGAALEKVTLWFNGLSPGMQDFIVKAAILFIVLGPVLMLLASMIRTITTLSGAFTILKATSWAAGLGVIGIIIALVAVFVWFGSVVNKNWEVLHAGMAEARRWIGESCDNIAARFGALGHVIAFIFDFVLTVVTDVFAGIFDVAAGLFNVLAGLFGGDMERVKHGFAQIGQGIGNIFIGIANTGIRAFNRLLDVVNGVMNWIDSKIEDGISIFGIEIVGPNQGLFKNDPIKKAKEFDYMDVGKYSKPEMSMDDEKSVLNKEKAKRDKAGIPGVKAPGTSGVPDLDMDTLMNEMAANAASYSAGSGNVTGGSGKSPKIPDANAGDKYTVNVDKLVAGDEKDAENLVKDMDSIKNNKKAGQGYTSASASTGGC